MKYQKFSVIDFYCYNIQFFKNEPQMFNFSFIIYKIPMSQTQITNGDLATKNQNAFLCQSKLRQNQQKSFLKGNSFMIKIQEYQQLQQNLEYYQQIEQPEAICWQLVSQNQGRSVYQKDCIFGGDSDFSIKRQYRQQQNYAIKYKTNQEFLLSSSQIHTHKSIIINGQDSLFCCYDKIKTENLSYQPPLQLFETPLKNNKNFVTKRPSQNKLKSYNEFQVNQIAFRLSKQGKKVAKILFDGQQIKTIKKLPKKSKISKYNQKAYCISSKEKINLNASKIEKRVTRNRKINEKSVYCQNYQQQKYQSHNKKQMRKKIFEKQILENCFQINRTCKQSKGFIILEDGTKVNQKNPFVILDDRKCSQIRNQKQQYKTQSQYLQRSYIIRQNDMNSVNFLKNSHEKCDKSIGQSFLNVQDLMNQAPFQIQSSFWLLRTSSIHDQTNLLNEKIIDQTNQLFVDNFPTSFNYQ